MFRKRYLQGCCILCFGLGLVVGHCVESWLLCCCGGMVLLILGFGVMRQK